MIIDARDVGAPTDAELKKDMAVAIFATIYSIFLMFASGTKFLVLSFADLAPGTMLYYTLAASSRKQVFTSSEWVIFGVFCIGAVYALYGLITGSITI